MKLGCRQGLCGAWGAGWGENKTRRDKKKKGKTGRRVGGLKPQPAFNFSQTTRCWCPMPYIFKDMYMSPLPAGNTDGDRNIQALGNQFLWCCFPCGACCWQTELAINSVNRRWTSSPVLGWRRHAAHHYLPQTVTLLHTCKSHSNEYDNFLEQQSSVFLSTCGAGTVCVLFRWPSIPMERKGYTKIFPCTWHPHHGTSSPSSLLFPLARRGRMINWHWLCTGIGCWTWLPR